MNKSTKIALGILGAAAVGVIIGGLFYTEKGKEIREQMGSKASDAKDALANWYNKGKEKIAEASNQMSRKANSLKANTEDIIS